MRSTVYSWSTRSMPSGPGWVSRNIAWTPSRSPARHRSGGAGASSREKLLDAVPADRVAESRRGAGGPTGVGGSIPAPQSDHHGSVVAPTRADVLLDHPRRRPTGIPVRVAGWQPGGLRSRRGWRTPRSARPPVGHREGGEGVPVPRSDSTPSSGAQPGNLDRPPGRSEALGCGLVRSRRNGAQNLALAETGVDRGVGDHSSRSHPRRCRGRAASLAGEGAPVDSSIEDHVDVARPPRQRGAGDSRSGLGRRRQARRGLPTMGDRPVRPEPATEGAVSPGTYPARASVRRSALASETCLAGVELETPADRLVTEIRSLYRDVITDLVRANPRRSGDRSPERRCGCTG